MGGRPQSRLQDFSFSSVTFFIPLEFAGPIISWAMLPLHNKFNKLQQKALRAQLVPVYWKVYKYANNFFMEAVSNLTEYLLLLNIVRLTPAQKIGRVHSRLNLRSRRRREKLVTATDLWQTLHRHQSVWPKAITYLSLKVLLESHMPDLQRGPDTAEAAGGRSDFFFFPSLWMVFRRRCAYSQDSSSTIGDHQVLNILQFLE